LTLGFSDKDVAWLDITMHVPYPVEILNALEKLYANVIDLSQREGLGFGVPRQGAAEEISHQ